MAEQEISVSWTETRTHMYTVQAPVKLVIDVVMELAPDIITDALVEAFDDAYTDVERMGPVLEEIRKRTQSTPDDDELQDLDDTSAYII